MWWARRILWVIIRQVIALAIACQMIVHSNHLAGTFECAAPLASGGQSVVPSADWPQPVHPLQLLAGSG